LLCFLPANHIKSHTSHKPNLPIAQPSCSTLFWPVILRITKHQLITMRSARLFFSLSSVILFTIMSNAQTNPAPVDRLGVKGPISFDSALYNLTWSSHPSAGYFKQEYIKKGEDVNKFNSMVMVEVATGAIILKDVVAAKVAELKNLQASNPFISYESFYNAEKEEYILDFVITQNSADGRSAMIAERNIYRYKALPKTGKTGIVLFALSIRSYGAATKTFLANIKTGRNILVDKVRLYTLPAITIK
jgi:hypothetical protein